ncbi:MAG: hypothetical protein OXG69_05685 [bacterium]|nr:hypothetical protein [bacterium]
MSSEKRTFRPFDVDQRLERALEGSELRFGDLTCEAGKSVTVDDGTFALRTVSLNWAAADGFSAFKSDLSAGAEAMGIDSRHVGLAVTVRSSGLKLHELVFKQRFSDLGDLNRSVVIEGSPEVSRRAVFLAETHGAVVDAYVALTDDLEPSPRQGGMRPRRAGTWLARASFRVRTSAESELFRPHPLDAENRLRLGLGAETLTFVEFDGDDLLERIDEGVVLTYWVDEELLRMLDAQRASLQAQYLQRRIAVDLISAVVNAFARPSDDEGGHERLQGYEELQDSIVGRVVRYLANATGTDRDQVLKDCRERPEKAVAMAEDVVGLRVAALKSLVPQ